MKAPYTARPGPDAAADFETDPIMETIIAYLSIPLAYLAAMGWGMLLERFSYGRSLGYGAYSATLGLLVWLVIGAVLNHLSLAKPVAYDLLLVSGLLLGYLHWRRYGTRSIKFPKAGDLVPIGIIILVAVYIAWGVLPAGAFNYHDDFYKYLPQTVKMLQTGTLAGNPYGRVGLDGLGMQQFLQGFFIQHLSFRFINAFDSVFCLLLAALLLESLGRELKLHWMMRSLLVLSFLVINPLIVNVSAVYSGSLMVIGVTFATLLLLGGQDHGPAIDRQRAALPVGLMLAAMAGLKVIFIPFAAGYLAILSIILLRYKSLPCPPLKALRWALVPGLGLFLVWAGLSWEKVLNLAGMAVSQIETVLSGLENNPLGMTSFYLKKGIEKGELFYGGHLHDYLGIFIVIAVSTAIAFYWYFRSSKNNPLLATSFIVSLSGLLSVIGILVAVFGMSVDGIVRYNGPVLIGVFVTTVPLVYRGIIRNRAAMPPTRAIVTHSIAALVLTVPLLMQGPLWIERAHNLSTLRNQLSFPVSDGRRKSLDAAMSQDREEYVRSIQERIPAETTLFSWFAQPFHLDFSRNRILTLATPKRFKAIDDIALDDRESWLRQQLKDEGVDYILWHHKAKPPPWGKEYMQAFTTTLLQMTFRNRILYLGPELVLFELE